jgi:1,5-anhydro-D-fructose reductase (1,5-anhydro-D-mannitol-forming)
VNFALSDQQASQHVEKALADGLVGDVLGVEIRLHFPEWPRKFQAGAAWIDGREQGGFVREVFSHFAYLTDRLLGPLEPVHVELIHGTPSPNLATFAAAHRVQRAVEAFHSG